MNLLNYLFKNNISAASATDRILEYISLAMGILIITLSIVFYLHAPERIPIHFTGTGKIDNWSEKYMYFVLMGIAIFMMILLNYSAYNYKLFNLPFKLNPDRLSYQSSLLGTMSRILSLLTGGLFMSILWMTASPQLGFSSTCVFPIFALCLFLMFATVFIYYILVWRAGRS